MLQNRTQIVTDLVTAVAEECFLLGARLVDTRVPVDAWPSIDISDFEDTGYVHSTNTIFLPWDLAASGITDSYSFLGSHLTEEVFHFLRDWSMARNHVPVDPFDLYTGIFHEAIARIGVGAATTNVQGTTLERLFAQEPDSQNRTETYQESVSKLRGFIHGIAQEPTNLAESATGLRESVDEDLIRLRNATQSLGRGAISFETYREKVGRIATGFSTMADNLNAIGADQAYPVEIFTYLGSQLDGIATDLARTTRGFRRGIRQFVNEIENFRRTVPSSFAVKQADFIRDRAYLLRSAVTHHFGYAIGDRYMAANPDFADVLPSAVAAPDDVLEGMFFTEIESFGPEFPLVVAQANETLDYLFERAENL